MSWTTGMGAGALSAAGSLAGSLISASASKKEASKVRRLQLYMANTAHQREVEDLRKAGLNPILSAGGAGASSPQMPTAQIPDYGRALSSGLSSGVQAASAHQDIKLKKVDVKLKQGMMAWLSRNPEYRDAFYGMLAANTAGLGGGKALAFMGINSALGSKAASGMWHRFLEWARTRPEPSDDLLIKGSILDRLFPDQPQQSERR